MAKSSLETTKGPKRGIIPAAEAMAKEMDEIIERADLPPDLRKIWESAPMIAALTGHERK